MSAPPDHGVRPGGGGTSPDPGPTPAGQPSEGEAGEEPRTTGTLFIMILFLMALAGMWGIMYLILLER